jgi:aflatoxin B1 aldehyde reductase
MEIEQVDVYYIHTPDRKVPFKDTIEGINELYKAGKFKRFGLSNFTPEEVEDVVRIAKENNFVLPSVYQGNYNAIGRLADTQLFPILREYDIAFYAYSPIAGGVLTKTPEDVTVHGKGRFDKSMGFFGQMYNALYNKPAMLEFLANFGKVASEDGISQAELAYRWVTYHSHLEADKGDAIIVGAGSVSQLKETLDWLRKGPLSQGTADKLDGLWKEVEGDAILDNFNDFVAKLGSS